MHIIISLGDKIDIITESEKRRCRGIVLPSKMAHTAHTNKNKVLVFLFDNTTSMANQIRTVSVLSDKVVEEIIKAYACFEKSDKTTVNYREFMECVYKGAGIFQRI